MTTDSTDTKRAQEIDLLKGKLIVAALISVPNIIVMNPTLVSGVAERLPAGSYAESLTWSIMALISVPVFLWAGSHLLLSLKSCTPNLESLVGLGLTGAFFYSIAIAVMPGFDTIAPYAVPLWDVIDVVVALALVVKIAQVSKASD